MKLNLKETAAFGMLGGMMFLSKLLMDALPNIHLLAMLTVAITLVFRQKALYPIYVYVGLMGVIYGFAPWWVPHLYLWTVLWGATMLIPRKLPKGWKLAVCIALCSAHGLLYGILYAPAQALLYGMSWQGTVAWIVAGFPFDLIHGIGNLFAGFLIAPVSVALQYSKKLLK